MSLVSSRQYEGYTIDAVWLSDPGETPKFEVLVIRPNGDTLGVWVMEFLGTTDQDQAERRALDLGAEQAEIDRLEGGNG